MAAAHILTDGPVVIFTASFEGEPADNAAQFVSWLQNLSSGDNLLKGVKYAVFGCGNREWARTYQRIPTLIDDLLEKNGAEKLLERGEADASSIEFFQAFEDYEPKLWQALEKVLSILSSLKRYYNLSSIFTGVWRRGENINKYC